MNINLKKKVRLYYYASQHRTEFFLLKEEEDPEDLKIVDFFSAFLSRIAKYSVYWYNGIYSSSHDTSLLYTQWYRASELVIARF